MFELEVGGEENCEATMVPTPTSSMKKLVQEFSGKDKRLIWSLAG